MRFSMKRLLMGIGACGIGIGLLSTTRTGRILITRAFRAVVEQGERDSLDEVFKRRRE